VVTVQCDLTKIRLFVSNFGPKHFFSSFKTGYEQLHIINQESSTVSDFKFPCKPLLGPSPELMQSQPSLRVVQGSISVALARKRCMLEVEMGGFWGGEAFLRPTFHWQCQLRTVPYTVITPYFTKLRYVQ
jgi:hypothetical protein